MGKLGDILSHPDELIPLVCQKCALYISASLASGRLGFLLLLLLSDKLVHAGVHVSCGKARSKTPQGGGATILLRHVE